MNFKLAEHFLAQLSEAEKELPVSPALLGELFRQTSSDSPLSLDDISGTISRDQALTAGVLSRANSAYYGFQGKISSISRAISLLGLSELRKILLFVTMSALSRKADQNVIDLGNYWEHQCLVAFLSQELGILCARDDYQELFVTGILHDLGKLMLVLYQPQVWRKVSEISAQKKVAFFQAEHEFWGLDHAVAGALVLKSWNLPEAITEAISAHHSPETAEQACAEQAMIVSLADAISYHHDREISREYHQIIGLLGLDEQKTMEAALKVSSDPGLVSLQRMLVH